ncbi:MFS transporter [Streptomyces sp. NPDC052396]|uniref:MFS transporter n=1 Tax=Streptomyces sp. NPDC052396 TaxID=3365689 RepID=UPI0037D2E464
MAAFLAVVLRLRDAGSGWVTAALLAEILPFVVLAPLAGALVDRLESRGLLIVVCLGQAAVSALLSAVGGPPATIALVALLGAQAAVERPATGALIPHITGEAGATRGYARLGTGRALGAIGGPALGGVLTVASGASTVMLLNAGSFLLLALALTAVSARRRPAGCAPLPEDAGTNRAGAGFRQLAHDRVLRLAIPLTALAAGIALADNVAAPYRFTQDFHAGAAGFGVYEALYSACELIGIQALARKAGRGQEERLLAAGNLLLGLGVLGIGLAAGYPLALAAAIVGGVGNGMSNAGEGAVIRLRTPEPLRGRTFAAGGALVQGMSVVGAAAGAPAVASLGAAATMVLTGTLAATAATAGLVTALLRRAAVDPSGRPGRPSSDIRTTALPG